MASMSGTYDDYYVIVIAFKQPVQRANKKSGLSVQMARVRASAARENTSWGVFQKMRPPLSLSAPFLRAWENPPKKMRTYGER